ncbi:MAG: hypothetical protein H6832_14160 [Planctomycetes bacterium]|nr:hypothetical protein [Planctomycetota bacterium]MCB9919542.1 hypothetical protein [Planctomycetota bacterium]
MIVKIDIEKMTHGKLIADLLCQKRGGGIPWFSILDPDKLEMVAHGTGPGGNVGFPVTEAEVDHFATCLQKARRHMSEEDAAFIIDALRENGRAIERARDEARKKQAVRRRG